VRQQLSIFNFQLSILQVPEQFFELHLVVYEHFAGLGAVVGADDACGFELVYYPACPVVAQLQFALQQGCGTELAGHDEPCRIVEELVFLLRVEVFVGLFVLVEVFRQQEAVGIAALRPDEVGKLFNLVGFDKGALDAHKVGAGK
jgi:hypothetical protein